MYSAKSTSPLQQVLTVSELTARIRELIEEVFSDVYVVGEVSNAKLYPSGHWYFSLKDKEATLSCVFFKTAAQSMKFRLEDGLMMVVRGRLSVYPPKGAYQMVVSSVEPVGVGEWQLAFEQLKARLTQEGLLAVERKRPLPIFPKRVGVVTSPAGAAVRDIVSALTRRNRNVNVVIAPAKVQGEGSAEEVAQAIRDLQTILDIEVIIVARGGGSIEDLWSFNTEVVARAVAECRVPTISGVGHETDVTICDLVADMRAPTPTAAAEMVARGSQELLDQFTFLSTRLNNAMNGKVVTLRRALERSSPLSSLLRYQQRLNKHRMEVGHLRYLIGASTDRILMKKKHEWRVATQKLIGLGPLNILKRGFAVIRKEDGKVVTNDAQVKVGDTLEALLEQGKLKINVQSIEDHWY